MNRVQTASPPLYLQPRRARLRGRPSGLKGRSAIAARRTRGPPLTPEPLQPLIEQRHGQAHGAARQAAGRSTEKSLQTSLYGSRGLPSSANAAVGGLKPPSQGGSEGPTILHLLHSIAFGS
jgi:hypothetical protein